MFNHIISTDINSNTKSKQKIQINISVYKNIFCKFARFCADQAGVRAHQAGVRTDQAGVCADQAGVRTDQAGVRADQAGMRADQATIEVSPIPLIILQLWMPHCSINSKHEHNGY